MRRPMSFVVSRFNWRASTGVWCRLPGATRMASFASHDEAVADRAKREQAARERVNPFHCGGGWAERTVMPEPIFRDYLQDADISPPDGFDWPAWWQATASTLTPDQRTQVWEGLTALRFYTADEYPVRPVAFAVVQIDWRFNDQWYYPDAEGGTVLTLYRTRERAEREAEELGGRQGGLFGEFFMGDRRFPGQDPFDPPPRAPVQSDGEWGQFGSDDVPYFEVVEVELEGGGE